MNGIRRSSLTKYYRSHTSAREQRYTTEDKRPHHKLSDIGAAAEECSKVGRVEWICDAPFWRRAGSRQRGLPAELADFAAELTGAARCEEQFSSQPVSASCDDAAFGYEPHAGIAVADIEDLFIGFEALSRAGRKANGKL